jgi:hypothetical protein
MGGQLHQRSPRRVFRISPFVAFGLLVIYFAFTGALRAGDEDPSTPLKWGLSALAGSEAGNATNRFDLGADLDVLWDKSDRIVFEAFTRWLSVGYMDGTDGQRLGAGLGVMEFPARLRFKGNRMFYEEHAAVYYQEQNLSRAVVDGVLGAGGVQIGIEVPLGIHLEAIAAVQLEILSLLTDMPSPQTYPDADHSQPLKTDSMLKIGLLW